ncbi:hypothetical protein JTE90_023618 [Oedothorax gibbosus]|uniref:ADP-ribosylation factor-like protein 16 n=1 Tax=Oedothorax gibbosus TaxID=931172 RepID=A0AAV6U654_9ARAC|nr:hypothetical protein JTE90_023618 [Oedothorax gibbosus]
MIICIGPKSAGKTLLLRKLQQADVYCDPYNEIFSTVPTVGVNIVNISLANDKTLQIHELGGSIAAIWNMHYDGCKSVIFLVDAANMQQVSCACILLLETLKHPSLRNSAFALVFNKTDVNSSVSVSEIKYLMRIDDILLHAKQDITVMETSCVTGKGLKDLKEWLLKFVD